MRWNLFPYLLLLLTRCTPVTVDELRRETPVMIAMVPSGQTTEGIQLFNLTEDENMVQSISNATINISNSGENNSTTLYYSDGGYYANFPILPNTSYTISGKVADRSFQAEFTLPPGLEFTIDLNDTLVIDATSTGSSIAIVTWTDLDHELYSYVVRMDCLEESPVAIPFNVNSGNFAENFNGPLVAPGIIVTDTDFRYYGKHRLTVFAIPKALEKIYFYNAGDIRGLLTNSPDNILGIKGFAVGVSILKTEFFLKPL